MKLYDQNFFDKDGNAKPEGASEEILARRAPGCIVR